jgi:hypothetical protein
MASKVRFDEGAFLIAETGYNWALAATPNPAPVKLGGLVSHGGRPHAVG